MDDDGVVGAGPFQGSSMTASRLFSFISMTACRGPAKFCHIRKFRKSALLLR